MPLDRLLESRGCSHNDDKPQTYKHVRFHRLIMTASRLKRKFAFAIRHKKKQYARHTRPLNPQLTGREQMNELNPLELFIKQQISQIKPPQISDRPRFLSGAILHTRLVCEPNDDGVSMEELVNAPYISNALLTTFMGNNVWISSQIPEHVPLCLIVNYDKGQQQFKKSLVENQYTPRSNLTRICLTPPKDNFGCLHTKLMLFEYTHKSRSAEEYLRVVVSSANLIPQDYTLVLFVQDLPKLSNPLAKTRVHPFRWHLEQALRTMETPQEWINKLKLYNFEGVKAHLIASAPGVYQGEDFSSFGINRLREVARHFRWDDSAGSTTEALMAIAKKKTKLRKCVDNISNDTKEVFEVEYGASSLGDYLSTDWLRSFVRAANGLDPLFTPLNYTTSCSPPLSGSCAVGKVIAEGRWRKGQRIQRKNKMVEIKASVEETIPPIKIVFPTEKVVNEALKMGLPRSRWLLNDFSSNNLRSLVSFFHAYEPRRGGALSHAKLFIARSLGSTDSRGYVYVGSHNLSHAAWGTVTLKEKRSQDFWEMAVTYKNSVDVTGSRGKKENKATKIIYAKRRKVDDWKRVGYENSQEGAMTLTMRNWELGVVVPLEDLKKGTGRRKVMGAQDEDIFKFVPWQRPVRSFRQGEKPYGNQLSLSRPLESADSLSLMFCHCFKSAKQMHQLTVDRQRGLVSTISQVKTKLLPKIQRLVRTMLWKRG
ncbi:hypothetical protein BC937DRAFT_87489 [Endogone sp. FLAS-F59071]|nr:hypothetical protein BC937DRAFT_87489 [Endogone sp. FLAS-F59071]|eukprot:RUS19434.1 hypothetical protein BC937DRAFT_87489 [Endogone sp. FLAS-F59071]